MTKDNILNVQGREILLSRINDLEYISLTDMAKDFGGNDQIKNWIRTRRTIEYLGTWETINNSHFNMVEFHHVKMATTSESFIISPTQWIKRTNAIGLIAKSGRYGGGTFAHVDIAFEFGSWLSPQFKLYPYTEFQRLKKTESETNNLEWNVKRVLTKANYRLHTNAIRDYIIPKLDLKKADESVIYANEAEILNMAVFGYTSKDWREANPSLKSTQANPRDFASINELAVLSNLEGIHSILIQQQLEKKTRYSILKKMATEQLANLNNLDLMKSIKKQNDTSYVKIKGPID